MIDDQYCPAVRQVETCENIVCVCVWIRLVIDDGTGEAHVWVSGALVRPLLGLSDCQWEGLQRAIKVRGHLEVNPWGRSLVSSTS